MAFAGCDPERERGDERNRPETEVQRFVGDAPCQCWSNLYDCPEFPTSRAAQDCYEHCLDLGRGDVHWLDRDRDGRACEWNPGGY